MSAWNENLRRHWLWLGVALFGLAFAVRLGYWFWRNRLHRDALTYMKMAMLLVENHWQWQTPELAEQMRDFPPLLTILQALGMEMGYSALTSGGAICLVAGALIPVLGYFCARKIFTRPRYAEVAALLLIFHPSLVDNSATILREPLFLAFYLGALLWWMTLVCPGMNWWRIGGYGVLVGLATLTRKEGVELLLVPLIWGCFCTFRSGISWRKAAAAIGYGGWLVVVWILIWLPFAVWTPAWTPWLYWRSIGG